MDLKVNQILKNGTIDALKGDGWVSGFIIGALEAGFSVTMPGAVIAKKAKLRVMAHTQGEGKKVIFMVGTQVLKEYPLEGFQWMDVMTRRMAVYYKNAYLGMIN